jgi:hypothetical protein
MEIQDKILDDLDRTIPKKTSFIKVLLIVLFLLFLGFMLCTMYFLYQFKDTTEL